MYIFSTKAMESLQDLIEEAKLRTVWWILCIFAVTYFLTHTSKSMLMNIPIAVLLVSATRILLNEVEFRWKVRNTTPASYLSQLGKKQLSVNDSRLTTVTFSQKWKRKIDSPVVEAAIEDFLDKILHDFVIDLWYSDITPDKDAPELIRTVVMDALGEVSGRIKEVNLVDLLTREVVDLIGDHIDLFRRNQAAIGSDVMRTLSSEERDERLKYHLLASKELHPALISPECEYKVLQHLMDGVLAVVLRPREAQCPLVRVIARELITCLVLQPVMNFASPEYINELIEYIITAFNDEGFKDLFTDRSANNHTVPEQDGQSSEFNLNKSTVFSDQGTDLQHAKEIESSSSENLLSSPMKDELIHPRHAEWAKGFEAATQRRTEVLMPENLENMWAIGRNYKKRLQKEPAPGFQTSQIADSASAASPRSDLSTEAPAHKPDTSIAAEDKASTLLPQRLTIDALSRSQGPNKEMSSKGDSTSHELETTASIVSNDSEDNLRRSSSTSAIKVQLNLENNFTSEVTAPIINEYYSAEDNKSNAHSSSEASHTRGPHVPKLRCRVIGAYFEKLDSNSFAVYLIAVTDAENNTWFVKRRYRNFERLHRHLRDIPNYALHLPPKRIFSSSTEDAFVHQRCIQLDKYLQDLLSVANLAEQHEVWDFVSASSKNYSFGKSSSAMKTLAVNVDDAVDDIVRQFKGVSDGLMRVVGGPPSSGHDPASSIASKNLSWNADDINKLALKRTTSESFYGFVDNEEGDKDANNGRAEEVCATQANGWYSENELYSNVLHPRVAKHGEDVIMHSFKAKSDYPEPSLALMPVPQDDPAGVPPEWTPPNLSVPILNLVDNVFQLNRRGWLRRQVFWISKQILQLVMEDAIDDWLLSQIQWVRQEDVIAQGIRWVQNILWPDGTFFRRLRIQEQLSNFQANPISQQTTTKPGVRRTTQPGSFEQQLEAARRASDVKKMIFNGAPTTLVSLIGHKQYRRCARDIYYFLQSTVCLKQLVYGILELVLISIFPELGHHVKDMHERMHNQPA